MKTAKFPRIWLDWAGCISNPRAEAEFQDLIKRMVGVLRRYDRKVPYKELYQIAEQAAVSAVGRLVSEYANQRDAERARRRKRRSR